MTSLQVTFLGTSAAVPSDSRSLSSIIINRDGTLFIFDAGEGMQYNFIRGRFGFNKKLYIFITHMHSDHIFGLLGFFQTLSLQGRKLPIDIFGPGLLREFLNSNIKILDIVLSFKLNIHVISQDNGILVDKREYKITYCKSEHGTHTHSFSYCLVENDRPGKFDIKKAQELRIPEGSLYSLLQKGESIKVGNKIVPSSTVVGPMRPGRKIGISGDTRPNNELCTFFKSCDLLIFEATFANSEITKAKESFHTTAYEAASLAKLASVDRLCLTHFSNRYKDINILLDEAKSVFPTVELAFDLKTISIPRKF